MNLDQAGTVLAVITGFDHRTVGESDIFAWQAVLHDVDFADARDAVIAHYSHSRDWIMPADVRHGALDIASHRAGRAKLAELGDDYDNTPTTPMTPDEWERFAQQARAHGVEPSIGRRVSGG